MSGGGRMVVRRSLTMMGVVKLNRGVEKIMDNSSTHNNIF